MFNNDPLLMSLVLPPECVSGEVISSAENIEKALLWYRRPTEDGTIKQDEFSWRLNFQELGLINAQGKPNPNICKKASEYVWSHRDDVPNFFKLKEHLALLIKTASPTIQLKKKIPKSALQKLKKRKRKQGRIKRK